MGLNGFFRYRQNPRHPIDVERELNEKLSKNSKSQKTHKRRDRTGFCTVIALKTRHATVPIH